MGLFSKDRCPLDAKEHAVLFFVLTGLACLRDRYAAAFLSAFSEDLSDALQKVVGAAEVIRSRRATLFGEGVSDEEREKALALACVIVACGVYRDRLMKGKSVCPDAEIATWFVIYILNDLAAQIDADLTAYVCGTIQQRYPSLLTYIVDQDAIDAINEWSRTCDSALVSYESGAIGDDDFMDAALHLFRTKPSLTEVS